MKIGAITRSLGQFEAQDDRCEFCAEATGFWSKFHLDASNLSGGRALDVCSCKKDRINVQDSTRP